MSKVLVSESSLSGIANSIRAKNGTQTTYTPSEMADAIDNLPSGGGDYNAKIDGTLAYNASYGMTSIIPEVDLDGINLTSFKYAFQNWTGLNSVKNINASSCKNFYYMFQGCTSLVTAPAMDTSNGRDFMSMFMLCSNLANVPVYDLSNINLNNSSKISSMFLACDSLTDVSLNNIMASCISATHISSGKTLKNLGLSSAQATRCQSLSNYTAFTSAGWTTGY